MSLSDDKVRKRLRGVAVGLLTPFGEESEIQYEKLEENAKSIYNEGIRTFLSTANISEYHSLTHDERVEVAETNVDAVPSDACVLAGVGGNTVEAQQLIREYDDVGVDAMMIMPPDHTYVHEQGLLQYYRKLTSVTETPLVPYVRGFNPSVEFLRDMSSVEGIVGIKYALEDPLKLGASVAAGDDDLVWVDGLAEPFSISFWNEGIEGFSAGVSNFRPKVGLELFDALSSGDWEYARQLRNICLPYQNFRGETGQNNTIPGAISVPAVKKGLDLAGLHGGQVREPICPLSPEEERRAEELYRQLDDDIEQVIG
ncbi:dihydrodipicolinate synthase family protein [Haladaptatus caseinilyticus]|uniref:dihydrodipicolinate synthase family protein n=1 Tax=Haladaptatus caseinilyticus TaxID=2993314 RepID=UPI00224AEA8C|nr:dihydrodipicolinate synthase family protein [Haladaptatus caseinilyticus]